MRKRDKKIQVLENIAILDAGSEGMAIAKVDGLVIFVNNAVPGDVADLQITRKKSGYREAKAIKFHALSEKRVKPLCEHFGICGGCKWQNMDYQEQLYFKQKQVFDNLKRLGKIDLPEIMPIIPSGEIFHYRNKLEFTFSNRRWITEEEMKTGAELIKDALGFHIPKMFDKIIDIENCYLQASPSNDLRNEVKKYAIENKYPFFDIRKQEGLLRNLIVRTSSKGQLMVLLSFFYDDREKINALLDHLAGKFPGISSLLYVINPKKNDTIHDLDVKLFKGENFIFEEMQGLKFKISAKSFYQTNSLQAQRLYEITKEFAAIESDQVVYDLYTGTGTIANYVASNSKKVVGIEYVPEAIEDAKENSKINNIHNTHFFSGDIKDILNIEFITAHGKPEVVITDPPRSGMHQDVVKKLLGIKPLRIVYVSCNPATQARDLELLDVDYKVEKIQPLDMFPHTHHVENVVLLNRRG